MIIFIWNFRNLVVLKWGNELRIKYYFFWFDLFWKVVNGEEVILVRIFIVGYIGKEIWFKS